MSETYPSYKEVLDAVSTLCAEYETEDGTIRFPGKYEGEYITTPYVNNLIDCNFAGEPALVEYTRHYVEGEEEADQSFVPNITEIELTDTEQSVLMSERWVYFFEDLMGFAYSVAFPVRQKVWANIDTVCWTFAPYSE